MQGLHRARSAAAKARESASHAILAALNKRGLSRYAAPAVLVLKYLTVGTKISNLYITAPGAPTSPPAARATEAAHAGHPRRRLPLARVRMRWTRRQRVCSLMARVRASTNSSSTRYSYMMASWRSMAKARIEVDYVCVSVYVCPHTSLMLLYMCPHPILMLLHMFLALLRLY